MTGRTKEEMREYTRERRKTRFELFFPTRDELEKFRGMAQACGYSSFNGWLLQMIHNATGGSLFPPDYVEALKSEVERNRRWLESAREEAEDLRSQVKTLQAQRDSLVVLMQGLPSGPETAAKFLVRSAREARS